MRVWKLFFCVFFITGSVYSQSFQVLGGANGGANGKIGFSPTMAINYQAFDTLSGLGLELRYQQFHYYNLGEEYGLEISPNYKWRLESGFMDLVAGIGPSILFSGGGKSSELGRNTTIGVRSGISFLIEEWFVECSYFFVPDEINNGDFEVFRSNFGVGVGFVF